MKRVRGFTIVELLVVVAVIGVLATISVVGFVQYQATQRDSERAAKATVIAEALEKYYEEHGEYPSCSTLSGNSQTVVGTGGPLQGVESATLLTPQAGSGTTNSITCSDLTSVSGSDIFAFVGDGSTTCQSGNSCLTYTIKYKKESDGTIASITSRRQTNINTSGAITLSGNAAGLSIINLTWTNVANASGYRLQRAPDPSFTTGVATSTPTSPSLVVNFLAVGTTYYFRVQATSASGNGSWSNTLSVTTQALAAPVLTATAISSSQIDLSWPDINYEDSYLLQYTTNGSSWSTPTPTPFTLAVNATSRSVTGLSAGTPYYFRLQGQKTENSSVYIGPWSADATATTVVPAPASITATTNSATQITVSWASVAVASSYRLEYSTSSSFTSPTPITGLTTTSRQVSSLNQGVTYYFRVFALVGSTSSAASPSANATTTVNTPSAPSITAYRPNAVRTYAAGDWVAWIDSPASGNWYYAYASASSSCPSGTSATWQFNSRYNSPATTYTTSNTSTATWYMVQPSNGYSIKFGARYFCSGPNANSSWSSWSESCAANPGSTVTCTY